MAEWWGKVIIISILIAEFLMSVIVAPEGRGTAWGPFALFLLGDFIVLCFIGYIVTKKEKKNKPLVPTIQEYSIEELARMADAGDQEAWRELVDRFRKMNEENKANRTTISLQEAVKINLSGGNIDVGTATGIRED